MTGPPPSVDVVVPTVGRPSLAQLLTRLGSAPGLGEVIVVDDRRDQFRGLPMGAAPETLGRRLRVVSGRAAGPASARNLGWRLSAAEWIAFVDDDVLPGSEWCHEVVRDVADAADDVAAVQGRIEVPLPVDRRPTDWERNVAGLSTARWITADMAVRRAALQLIAGFDERFPRAYREDVDLGLRLVDAGWRLTVGERRVQHPVRPADRWVSVRQQAGNADDALMTVLHGRRWRDRAGAPSGARRRHLLTTLAGASAVGLGLRGRRIAAGAAAAGWLAGSAAFARERIAPGPRTADEVVTMILTSAVIPVAATFHWARGWVQVPRQLAVSPSDPRLLPQAVLWDRDGTLIEDVPYNGDPSLVVPVDGAADALRRLRRSGVKVGLITNQSGVARGHLSHRDAEAVNRRVDQLLGPFDIIEMCVHDAAAGCACRKPEPGMVLAAAESLGVDVDRCVVVGDIGADVVAARRAGARGVLVPNGRTRPAEILSSDVVAVTVADAVDLILGCQVANGGSSSR